MKIHRNESSFKRVNEGKQKRKSKIENNWSKARRFPRLNVDLIFYCLFIKASHELLGSCFGQQIKDQPESIDFPSGQRKSETVRCRTKRIRAVVLWFG